MREERAASSVQRPGNDPATAESSEGDSRSAERWTLYAEHSTLNASARSLWVVDLGTRAYGEVLELQRRVAAARIAGDVPEDVLLLVEHPPVVTLGRSARASHLLATPALLAARGVELYEVERGGDVTFHGPGQLVGYPIIDLARHRRDLHWYLRAVEEVLIRALAEFGIGGERSSGYTGVWTGRREGSAHPARKIASIGVHARNWVTWHGFALNVTTDLSLFGLIVPCGIQDVEMTSIARELPGRGVTMTQVRAAVVRAAAEVFDLRAVVRDAASLGEPAAVAPADRPIDRASSSAVV